MLYAAAVAVVFGAMFAGAAQARTAKQWMFFVCIDGIIEQLNTIKREFPDYEPEIWPQSLERNPEGPDYLTMVIEVMTYHRENATDTFAGELADETCLKAWEYKLLLDSLREGQ